VVFVVEVTIGADAVQHVVAAIRHTGTEQDIISLPGAPYTLVEYFVSNGSFASLSRVTNSGREYENLIVDVDKSLDVDDSAEVYHLAPRPMLVEHDTDIFTGGTHAECHTENIDSTFASLATLLGRHYCIAIPSKTGDGNVTLYVQDLCQKIAFSNDHSDVHFGYVGQAGKCCPGNESGW